MVFRHQRLMRYGCLFFVRVILFLMSRQADDAVEPSLAKHAPSSGGKGRTSTRHASIAPTHSYQQDGYDSDAVTKEEMVKLFGSALRVR
jgi:hypothetical protein